MHPLISLLSLLAYTRWRGGDGVDWAEVIIQVHNHDYASLDPVSRIRYPHHVRSVSLSHHYPAAITAVLTVPEQVSTRTSLSPGADSENWYQLPEVALIMADAIGLTAAILTLVTTAYSSCQKLYSTFDGIRDAPKHIAVITKDLEDFYLVLGTIQALLDDDEFSAGIVQYAQSKNLCKVLEDCISVFKDFEIIISEYQAHSKDPAFRTWQRLKWTFKESKIKDLRTNLSGCKATLNLAISIANQWVYLTSKDPS